MSMDAYLGVIDIADKSMSVCLFIFFIRNKNDGYGSLSKNFGWELKNRLIKSA